MSTLVVAEKQLSAKPALALEALLEVWRDTWHPGVGRLIERLGDSLEAPALELPATQSGKAEKLAEAVRKTTPAHRSAVISAFRDFAGSAQGSKVWPSIEAWATIDPDPRVARMALELLSDKEAVNNLTAKLWRRLANCVEHHGDLGFVAPANELAKALPSGGWAGAYPVRLKNIAKKLDAGRKPKAIDEAALARLEKALPANATSTRSKLPKAPSQSKDSEALLAEICSHPEDDAPRLAYADWLTEHGDPRGEFIVLQISRARGKVSKEAQAREQALFAQHRKRFLGNLHEYVQLSGLRFERGFVAKAKLINRVPALPELALLEDVELECTLAQPSLLSGVKRIRNAFPDLLKTLLNVAAPTQVSSRECSTVELADLSSKSVERLELVTREAPGPMLTCLAGFPSLRELQVRAFVSPWDVEPRGTVPAMFTAEQLRALPDDLLLEVDLQGVVQLSLKKNGNAVTSLDITLGQWGNQYTQGRLAAGAIASFVSRPVAVKVKVEAGASALSDSKAARLATLEKYLAPVRAGAKTLKL